MCVALVRIVSSQDCARKRLRARERRARGAPDRSIYPIYIDPGRPGAARHVAERKRPDHAGGCGLYSAHMHVYVTCAARATAIVSCWIDLDRSNRDHAGTGPARARACQALPSRAWPAALARQSQAGPGRARRRRRPRMYHRPARHARVIPRTRRAWGSPRASPRESRRAGRMRLEAAVQKARPSPRGLHR